MVLPGQALVRLLDFEQGSGFRDAQKLIKAHSGSLRLSEEFIVDGGLGLEGGVPSSDGGDGDGAERPEGEARTRIR